jgi:hypothetical protein
VERVRERALGEGVEPFGRICQPLFPSLIPSPPSPHQLTLLLTSLSFQWLPPKGQYAQSNYGAPSFYGRQTVYEQPISQGMSPARGMSPSPSYYNQQPQQHQQYGGGYPQSGYGGNHSPGESANRSQYFGGSQAGGGYRDDPTPAAAAPRPPSNFLGSFPSAAPLGVRPPPTDEELEASVQRLLAQADLSQVTKKAVRKDLEKEVSRRFCLPFRSLALSLIPGPTSSPYQYGVELVSRKDFINHAIEQALTSQQ